MTLPLALQDGTTFRRASMILYRLRPRRFRSRRPQGNFAITWGIDNQLKTPYTEAFDLSMQHQFPAGFTFELAYVGRLGNHLLQALDLAEPVDYTDPNGGGDYYTAGSTLSKEVDENGGNPIRECAGDTLLRECLPVHGE